MSNGTKSELSTISLDLQSSTPLYQQIIDQVRLGVVIGRFKPGQQLPTVRGLAGRYEINHGTVAKAYVELERQGVIVTHRGGGSYVADMSRAEELADVREARLWGIVGKAALEALSLGYSPSEIEAAFALHMARWRSEREMGKTGSVIARLAENHHIIVLTGSHDLALDLLNSHLTRRFPDMSLSITHVGSLGGLIALQREEAHVAGSHLLDEETGEYNVPFVRRLLPGQEVVLVTLAHRIQGLIVRKGNPKDIVKLEDLARSDVSFVNRQRGSGTRVLLDYKLRQLQIEPADIQGYDRETDTHVGTASAVADGTADVGLGILAASRSLGLGFVPLLKERYDLIMTRRNYESDLLRPLLEVVADLGYRGVVEAMGGYDVTEMGKTTFVS
jgi:molybdate-binding protein/DNA-binding transcriptional regulator YhcF (GntR family)